MKQLKRLSLTELLFFIFMFFFVLQGCVQKRADSQDESLPYIVDIEECLEKEHTVLLSELVDTIDKELEILFRIRHSGRPDLPIGLSVHLSVVQRKTVDIGNSLVVSDLLLSH